MPKVSICIPAYNNEHSIERLLNSIYNQTCKDYEIIITDDSADNRIKELLKKYPDVLYYKNEKRLGSTANWNEAISKSHGEYIKIMHHDDWFNGERSLEKLVDLLNNNEADFAFCGTLQVDNESYERHISLKDIKLIKEDYRNLYLGNTIGAPSATIYRRSIISFDENLTWLVDLEFYMNMLKNNKAFAYTEEPLIAIGVSKEQLTETCISDREINIFEYGYIYKKYSLKLNKLCRKKIINVFLKNDANYSIAKKYGISAKTYYLAKFKKILSKIAWKLGMKNGKSKNI